MKQKILRKRGALQEGFGDEVVQQSNMAPSFAFASNKNEDLYVNDGFTQRLLDESSETSALYKSPSHFAASAANLSPQSGIQEDLSVGGEFASRGGASVSSRERRARTSSVDRTTYQGESSGMFRYTVPEGQRVLVFDRQGQGTLLEGPQRIWRWGRKVQKLEHHVAYPGEFLVVRYRDGRQEHIPGPCESWLDPRVHAAIEKEDALQIAAKEAVVVYSRNDEEQIHRRIVKGPAVFVPKPGEWLHTFSWHGSRGDSYRKYPGLLVFQKLWLMPDQMYHDVDDARTADDVVLTVRLMLFFELLDLERMLDETHDPIGDFINAASSDVLDLVGRYTFDTFKTRTELLSDIANYPQLLGRAEQVGYKLHKIVYRGYSTSPALEAMHGQAIETRTRLKLERETETQAQELADFKQQREAQRAIEIRNQEREQEVHELEQAQRRHEQQLQLIESKRKVEREQKQADELQRMKRQEQAQERWLETVKALQELGVDLSAYLTQGRADKVIELRGPGGEITPHLHLPEENP